MFFFIRLLPYFTCTYNYMGGRIAGRQDRPSLIIEAPLPPPHPRAPQIGKHLFFHILAHIWKTSFQLFSLISTVKRSVYVDILLPSGARTQKRIFFASYLSIQLKRFLSDCVHIWHVNYYKWEGRCESIWTQSDYLSPPPQKKICLCFHIVAYIIWKTYN